MAAEEHTWRDHFDLRRGAFGMLSGLLGGTGASIVITQSGDLNLSWFYGLPLLTALVAGVWAAYRAPRWLDRAVSLVFVVYLIGSLVLSATPPALAQQDCGFRFRSNSVTQLDGIKIPARDARPVADLAEEPLLLRPRAGMTLELLPPGNINGWAQITVESVSPGILGRVVRGEPTVWHGTLDAGDPPIIRVADTTWRGAELVGNGVRAEMVPFGRVVIQAEVRSFDDQLLCDEPIVANFELVAPALSTWLGGASTLLLIGGLGGAIGLGLTPSPPPRKPVKGRPTVAPPGEWIPDGGLRADFAECRFTEETPDGVRAVDPHEPLVAGRAYQLEIQITPEVREQEDPDNPREMTASIWTGDFDVKVERYLNLSALGGLITFSIPVTPRMPGKRKFDINLMTDGHLLQVERVRTKVVAEGAANSTPARWWRRWLGRSNQSAETLISASNFTQGDLSKRTRRTLQVIVLRDDDGSIDVQFRNSSNVLLAGFDNRHQSEVVLEDAKNTRELLVELLRTDSRFGAGVGATPEQLSAGLPRLAIMGRTLHDGLFPEDGQRSDGTAAELRAALEGGGTIQVSQDYASLSVATLPWTFVYDKLIDPGPDLTVCDSFRTHDPMRCPHAADAKVVCPSGFWGYRYQIEQPPAWVSDHLPPLLVERVPSTPRMHFIYDGSFRNATAHRDQLRDELGMTLVEASSWQQVKAGWKAEAATFDLIYFYTHAETEPDTGVGSLRIGEDRMTYQNLRAWDPKFTRNPLVVINGCASGAYTEKTHSSLLNAFRKHGASGVVGTECVLTTIIAAPMMEQLMERLTTGTHLGQALLELRRELFAVSNSPIGLLYALYARSDLALATVEQPEPVPVT